MFRSFPPAYISRQRLTEFRPSVNFRTVEGDNSMRELVYVTVIAGVLAIAAGPAIAAKSDEDRDFSIGLSKGVLSKTIDGTYFVNNKLSLRGSAYYGTQEYRTPNLFKGIDIGPLSFLGDVGYGYEIRMAGAGLLADYHFLGSNRGGNSLMLTGGVYLNGNKFSGFFTPLSTVQIGAGFYDPIDLITMRVDFETRNALAPYIGIGAETNFGTGVPVSGFMRVGALFQGPFDPHLTIGKPGHPVTDADIALEEKEIGDITSLSVLPVVSIGLVYRF